MEQMTSAERLAAALSGQPVDRIPWSPFLAYVWEYFPAEVQQRGQLAFHHEIGADPLWRGAPCPVRVTIDGLTYTQRTEGDYTYHYQETPVGTLTWTHRVSGVGNTNFLCEHPLKTAEDFKVQLWMEEHTTLSYDEDPVGDHLQGEGREGLSIGMLIPRSKTAFQQLIEFYVGTEEMAYALADYPEIVEELRLAMVANDLAAAQLAAESPYDYFLTWEDSSTQNYSPAQYSACIASEITEFCTILGATGKHYIQHACGHLRAILPTMAASGICAVESLSPPPTGNLALAEARAMLGSHTGIIGGIEPVAFLQTPLAALPAYVEQVIADGAGGPFVLANSDSCPPGVTIEKFVRIGQLVRELAIAAG